MKPKKKFKFRNENQIIDYLKENIRFDKKIINIGLAGGVSWTKTYKKIVKSIIIIIFNYMPNNWFISNFDHRLGFCLRLFS